MRLVDSFVESEAGGNFLVGWITQDCGAATDEDWQIIDRKRKAIEHFLNFRIVLEIDVRIGLVVASEKLLDAKGVQQMTGANQNDVASFTRNQFKTAQNEGSQ